MLHALRPDCYIRDLVHSPEATMPEFHDENMTTWRSIGRGSLGDARITDSPSQSDRCKRNSRQPLNFPEEENPRASLISHQLVYQINSEAGNSIERENWLEHEVQPTDSEIESIYKDRSSGLNEDPSSTPIANVSRNTSLASECDTMENDQCREYKNGGLTSMPRSLARSVIDLSEPMSKEELLRTMDTLRDIYQKKFGGWPDNGKQNGIDPASISVTRQTVERMDKDIDDLRSRVIKLSVEQHKLKEMLGVVYSPGTVQASPVATNEYKTSQSQHSGIYQSTSTASSELRTPSPRDAAMFIPMDEDNDDLEDKLKQRDKLISRQLQRRENLLQRRIQRATEKRYLEEERRLQEQWMEKAKADHDMRRNLILQSHQLEKQEERNYGTLPSRSDKRTPTQLQSFLNGHEPIGDMDDYLFARRKASASSGIPSVLSGKSSLDMSSNRFMAPTAASQRRMNRAASLMSGLNNPDLQISPNNNNLSANSGSLHDLRVNGTTTPQVGYGNNSHNKLNDSRFGLATTGSRINGSTLSLSSNGGRQSRTAGRPSTKTNRNFMVNAITHVSLAGQANKKQRDAVLQEIEASSARHFMILFRDHRLLYRALYTYSTDALSVEKIHGIGPMSVDESMIEKFFKYNSGNRSFVFIPAKRFSIQCDAFIIHDEYWHKRNRR